MSTEQIEIYVLPNKDQLMLNRVTGTWFNINPGTVLELSYGKYNLGEYGDDTPNKNKNHFMVIGIEYFPNTNEGLKEAQELMTQRKISLYPSKTQYPKYTLESLLGRIKLV